mmetsp:Transcript_52326/g.86609  ORF Transcript_52326/g.86609 Transcript_52326/m.86609 type:complete len:280 (-) Transcript_52326:182-1021(-)
MWHCALTNFSHKQAYDLCEKCGAKNALRIGCKFCKKAPAMIKKPVNAKHMHLACWQCTKPVTYGNKYMYACAACHKCHFCMSCAFQTAAVQTKKPRQKNVLDAMPSAQLQQKMTTLHGYAMVGPYQPAKDSVWYCDHKQCVYTQHGVYRKYKITNWRSSQFGKKFILCDGCVQQFGKQETIVIQPAPTIDVNLNMNAQPQPQYYVQPPQPLPAYPSANMDGYAPAQPVARYRSATEMMTDIPPHPGAAQNISKNRSQSEVFDDDQPEGVEVVGKQWTLQ